MAITRDADTDDDGSGTTGTIRNAAWKTQLYDRIDAAIDGADAAIRTVPKGGTGAATLTDGGVLVGNGTGVIQATAVGTAGQVLTSNGAGVDPTFQAASSGAWTVATPSTLTGAQNNWAPGISGNTYVAWNGASDAAFTGIAGGAAGQFLTVKNITAAMVATFAHNSGSSSAGNKLKNFATSAATPVAPGGSITYQYDGTDWQIVAHEQGAWITPAFAAGNFTANGSMTWTVDAGDVTTLRYRLSGRTLFIGVQLVSTTVGGTLNTDLLMVVPGGFTTAGELRPPVNLQDNATRVAGYAYAVGTATLKFRRYDDGNFSAATNATQVLGSIQVEVT